MALFRNIASCVLSRPRSFANKVELNQICFGAVLILNGIFFGGVNFGPGKSLSFDSVMQYLLQGVLQDTSRLNQAEYISALRI